MQAAVPPRPPGYDARATMNRSSATVRGDRRSSLALRLATAKWSAAAWCAAAWLVGFARSIDPGIPASGASVHPSFEQSLGMALRDGFDFGTRVLFTFGPLGWFNTSPFIGELWGWKVAWELAVRGGIVALWVALSLRLERKLERLALLACLVLPGMSSDAWWFLAAVGAFAWTSAQRSRGAWSLACAVWSVVALVKFTFLACAFGCSMIALLAVARASGARELALRAALGAAIFCAIWCAIGQSLASLPPYLAWSIELARGYSAAMSQPAPPLALALAAGSAGVALAAGWAQLRATSDRIRGASALLVLAWGLAVAFKGGFVRYDGAVMLFGFAASAPYLLAASRERAAPSAPAAPTGPTGHVARRWSRIAALLRAAGIVLACGGTLAVAPGIDAPAHIASHVREGIARGLRVLAAPSAHRDELASASAARAKAFALPRVCKTVGDAPIEVFGWEQAVLELNRLHWCPRYVTQSYSVLTARLAQRNARALEAPDAPRFVLLRGGSLDLRLPTLEDGLAWRVLMRDFRVRLAEGGFVLLERRDDAPRAASDLGEELVLERSLAFDEELALSDPGSDALRLEIEIEPTFAGRLRTLAYNGTAVWVEIATDDGVRSRWRLLPELASTGAIVAPFLADHDALVRWLCGAGVPRATSVRIVRPDGSGENGGWSSQLRVRALRMHGLRPRVDDPRAIEFSMFASAPSEVTGEQRPRRALFRERDEILIVGTPSALVYARAPGPARVRATFGVQRQPSTAALQGARFVVRARRGESVRDVWRRELDPLARPDDRFQARLDVALELAEGERLELSVEPLQPGPSALAPYWTAVAVE